MDGHGRLKERGAVVACLVCALLAAAFLARRLELVTPPWVAWESGTLACDLDGDGTEERISFGGGRLSVCDGTGRALFSSEGGWKVSDALADDVNGDGLPELVMLVWRRGNYGSSRPFWETGTDLRMTQHLYAMGLRDGTMRPVWMSHELGHGLRVARMRAEGGNRLVLTDVEGRTSVWEWDYFGFTLVGDAD